MIKTYTACYSREADMTFIVCDEWSDAETITATEVVGFYCGMPNEEDTERYIGDLRAEYC